MQFEHDPDVAWVEALSGRSFGAAARAVAEAQGERRLFAHLGREHEREGRRSYIEIDAPLELHALVRLVRPRHVVEVGVSSGVSSAYLLNALAKNGRGTLHSIDLPQKPRSRTCSGAPPRDSWSLPPGRSSGWAVPTSLRRGWDLRLGDKRELLPILARELPRIDLFVYDVPHEDRDTAAELRLLDPRFPPGGVAIIDHGPSGGLCPALNGWARAHRTRPVRRSGLGLFGARRPTASRGASRPKSKSVRSRRAAATGHREDPGA
ncbi:MAG: class I SAM-dependent methyltransferase [Thermoplasmata archaeon]